MPAHLIVEEGPLQGLLLDLSQGEEWVLGRDPDEVDFVIEDATVSRKHARIFKKTDGFYIENLSQVNPTLINGEEQEQTLLQEGDLVQFGHTTFRFSEEAAMSAPKSKGGYDDIFGELEEPPPPPREEPTEEERPREESPSMEAPHETDETPYDTIFEDTNAEEELPFNLLSPAALLLKVISGPNAGAEIGIEKGRSYTIGKDSNSCDVVFQDLSVSREHARLTVTAEGTLELEDLGSKNGTVVNGTAITEKKILTPQDLVALGTTVFLIIDRDAPQDTIYSPILHTLETSTKAEEMLLSTGTEPIEEDWKKKPLPTKHLVIGASLIVIFFIVFVSFFSLFKSESMVVTEKKPKEQIEEALSKFTDVQFSFNPASGKLFLVGHVLTAVNYQELQYQISTLAFIQSVENNVVIDELVSKMNNDVLSTNPAWRSISIQAPKPGQFVATGYLETTEQGADLWEYLTVNFPYLDRLQNQVVIEQNLTLQVQSLFASRGFGGVTYQLTNGDIVLSGKYSYKMEREFEELLKELNGLKGVARVNNYALAASPNEVGIDLSQQYAVTGTAMQDGSGYSAILNGKIYTVGAVIDGMQITAIEAGRVLLEKDGLKYKIDYTR
jgi:type III secretion system YscD/HrpQ family protein